MKLVNGHPPNMIANQKVITTETMPNSTKMGIGGLTRPPTTTWQMTPASKPMAAFTRTSRIPFRGCALEDAKAGLAPHVTPITISIGMMDAITKITQLPSVEKSKSAMKPKEAAMIRAVATIPSAGCLMQYSYLGSLESRQYTTTEWRAYAGTGRWCHVHAVSTMRRMSWYSALQPRTRLAIDGSATSCGGSPARRGRSTCG